ncbi:MAG: hypothetical protein QGF74_00030 [Candidatus Nanoarchaeia archaeon]|jgi:hypothetical protein|nr:hypothetical protein [Candidatus Nanoarchaeia archaeon]|tara:strand:- start:3805 stop:3963 length:159 start_codon:yes stop_codon:yes gene_type:complete
MGCEHLKNLHKFLENNDIEFNSPEMIKITCKKCKLNEECTFIPLERFDELKK